MQEANSPPGTGAGPARCLRRSFSARPVHHTPPSSPSDGDAYLIGGSPTGVWSGYSYKIASCIDGAWRFYTPFNGLRAYVATTGAFVVYVNGVWTDWNSLISANEASIASAATCDLGAAGSLFVAVTGTTTVTGLRHLRQQTALRALPGASTLTHNATSLILLGGASRTTAAAISHLCIGRKRQLERARLFARRRRSRRLRDQERHGNLRQQDAHRAENFHHLEHRHTDASDLDRHAGRTCHDRYVRPTSIDQPSNHHADDYRRYRRLLRRRGQSGRIRCFHNRLRQRGFSTTATTANVTSIALTAGDWDVTGLVEFIAASATVAANAPIYAGLDRPAQRSTDTQYSLMRAGAMTTTSSFAVEIPSSTRRSFGFR